MAHTEIGKITKGGRSFDYEEDVVVYPMGDYINDSGVGSGTKKDQIHNYLKIDRVTGFGNLHLDFVSKAGKNTIMSIPENIPRAKELIEVQSAIIDTEIWTYCKQTGWYNLGDVRTNEVHWSKANKRVIVNLWGYFSL